MKLDLNWLTFFIHFLDGTTASKSELHSLAFEIPPPKYSAESILKLLLNPGIDQSRVCCVWPVSNIKANAMFVVDDITSLKHPDDVRKDFFGKWIHSGSHPFTFKATVEANGVMRLHMHVIYMDLFLTMQACKKHWTGVFCSLTCQAMRYTIN